MKLVPILAALSIAAASQADRFILAPNGKKIPFGVVRLEHMFDAVHREQSVTYLGFGLTKFFDAEVGLDDFHQDERKTVLNLAVNLVDPVVNFAPGISFGVQDVGRASERGRRFFAAMTWREGLDNELNYDTPMEITLGYQKGDRTGAIVGFMIPFARFFRGLAEFDAGVTTAGIEIRPARTASIRWLHQNHRVFWGLALSHRF